MTEGMLQQEIKLENFYLIRSLGYRCWLWDCLLTVADARQADAELRKYIWSDIVVVEVVDQIWTSMTPCQLALKLN